MNTASETTGGRLNLFPGMSKPVQHDPATSLSALPTPFWETLGASLENVAANEKYSSDTNVLQSQADKELQRIQQETGVALPNPYRYDPMIMNQEQAWEMWDKHVEKLAKTNPTTRIPTRSDFEAMGAERQQSVAERNEAALAGEKGFASGVARFIGEGVGNISDPINLAANFAPGAAWSAGVLKQGVTAVLKELGKVMGVAALTNIGAVAVTEPLDQHATTGQFDMKRYVTNLALAGVFGAGLGGVVRGGGFAGEAAMNLISKRLQNNREARVRFVQGLPEDMLSPEQKQALMVEERLLEREKGNPLGNTYEGQKQHGQLIDAQDKAISEGKLVPDNDPVSAEPFNQLEEFDQSVAEQLQAVGDDDTVNALLGEAGGDPVILDTWIDGLRGVDKAEGETLGQYVQRHVDQADKYRPALRVHDSQAGITTDMAKAVHDAGFTDRLLTPDELARLLEQEAAGKPTRKPGAQIVGDGGATLARQASVLDRLVPEWRTLKSSEVKARLNMLLEARQRQISGPAIKNPEQVMKERAAQAEAHNVQLDEELKPANQGQLSDLERRAVAEQAMANPTEIVAFEREDGSTERVTIGEMLKRMSDQDREFSVISKCLVGGP